MEDLYQPPWIFQEYKTPKLYFDPLLNTQDVKIQKPNKKTTKNSPRTSFIDDYIRIHKKSPGPQYKTQTEWAEAKPSNPKNLRALKLKTCLEEIQFQEQRKSPGVGKYNVSKTQEQIEAEIKNLKQKKVKQSVKISPFEENQSFAIQVPGVGNYNPYDVIQRIKQDRTDRKFWINKHKELAKIEPKIKAEICSYSPEPVDYDTFSKIQAEKDRRPSKIWGTDSRFDYNRQKKSKSTYSVPSPQKYSLTIGWPSKGTKEKQGGWSTVVSKGIEYSIYK